MRNLLTSMTVLTLISCGGLITEEKEKESGTNLVEEEDPYKGDRGYQGAKGDTGDQGLKGDSGTSTDGVDGEAGTNGINFSVGVFDKGGIFVGYFLNSVGNVNSVLDRVYSILTEDDLYAIIDIDDGTLKLPVAKSASCTYTTNNCTGTCYAPDEDYRGLIVNSIGGMFYTPIDVLPESIQVLSYANSVNACVQINTLFPDVHPSLPYTGKLTTVVAPLRLRSQK